MSILAVLAATLSAAWAVPSESEPLYPAWQLGFHGGLLQPVLTQGFNAAVEVRHRRFIATYSHGEGLDLTSFAGLPVEQTAAGVTAELVWTTGGGVGASLWKELYVLADLKVHGVEIDTGLNPVRYTTVTAGGEVGYRLFVWEGLHVTPVVRYWPNVASTLPVGSTLSGPAGDFSHDPLKQGAQGVFANVLVGWAFDVKGKRRTRALIR